MRDVLRSIDWEGVVRLLRELVAAPSENPPGEEAAVVAVLRHWLERAGLAVTVDEVAPGRPNLSVALGDGPGPVLLLNAHTDTMPTGDGWTRDPFGGIVEAGRLYGRGACDAKGGLAALVGAMLAVRNAGIRLSGRAVLDAVIDEEAGAAGTRRAIERGRRADWAIVTEPTELRVVRLGTGQVDLEVDVRGRAAHGSTPEVGRSAISDAAALVAAIEADNARLAALAHRHIGPASWSVGTIEGGIQTSIVPASCRMTVDRRLLPGQRTEEATHDLDRIIERVRARRPGLDARCRSFLEIPAFETPANAPVARALRRAVRDVGREGEAEGSATGRGSGARAVPRGPGGLAGMRATSDAAWLVEAGIPTVVFGPGSIAESAHRPDEFVPLDEVLAATRAVALTIVRLLG
jgi:acetylornithine deacetylase/succinyl-diaminopimelate desuccinylase family protein